MTLRPRAAMTPFKKPALALLLVCLSALPRSTARKVLPGRGPRGGGHAMVYDERRGLTMLVWGPLDRCHAAVGLGWRQLAVV